MKVILKEDVVNLGAMGQVVSVKDGYARNYLIPQGKALPATPENIKGFEQRKKALLKRTEVMFQEAEALAARLKDLEVKIHRRVGDTGKLYGSVSAKDIAKAIKEAGKEVEKKAIILKTPIRDLGEFEVTIRLHPKVSTKIKVIITQEE